MYEEDEGNGRLMPCKAGTHPLIWAQSAGESVQHPEGAFEVSIVLEAPATNHLLVAQTEHCPNTDTLDTNTHTHTLKCMHTCSQTHTQAQGNIKE